MGVFGGISEQPTQGACNELLPVLCPSCFFLERERAVGAAGQPLGGNDGDTSEAAIVGPN